MEADDENGYYEQLRSNEETYPVTQLPPFPIDNNGAAFCMLHVYYFCKHKSFIETMLKFLL